jgi:spore maturation protein CgeB
MKLVVFGLTISSSWGNGHSTLWRGLCRALAADGHRISFFERDVSYYAGARDLYEVPGGGDLIFYPDWESVRQRAAQELDDADVAIVTSYCPDAIAASDLVHDSSALSVFYDLDTPITLSRLMRGEPIFYIGPNGLAEFDLVLSYTGGGALTALRDLLGARRTVPLYGHVDPDQHRPAAPREVYRGELSYLGTYAADRQQALESLLLEPARRLPDRRFVIGGAQYPQDFPWGDNIFFVRHLPPPEHPHFFASSRATLNITRQDMAAMGWCPSGRLFEASACGAPILSDSWDGLDAFFTPGSEVLVVRNADDVFAALELGDETLKAIGQRARARTLAEHTAQHRAQELLAILHETQTGPYGVSRQAPPLEA